MAKRARGYLSTGSKQRRSSVRLLAQLAVACLAACTDPVNATNDYAPPRPSSSTIVSKLKGCKIAVTEIKDSRADPTTIGFIGLRPVRGPGNPQAWIGNVLSGLNTYGLDVEYPASDAPPTELVAKATLVTAWVSSIATAKTGSVVLNVRFSRGDTLVKEANYRGAESSVDWWGSDGEIQGMIDDAMTQILEAMSHDLVNLCSPAS
jgi:hypothetical protein